MSNKLKPCVLLPGWVVSVPTVGVLGDRNVDVIDCGMPVWLQRSAREKRNVTVTRKTSQMTGLRLGERRMGEIACMVVVVVVVEREREWNAYTYETTCTKRAETSQPEHR